MEEYNRVFEHNRQWAAAKKRSDPDFFDRLAEGQAPDFLYIGCSDARVPASALMGTEAGDVFVHRNIANLVVNTDLNVHSVIEYAVEHLQVEHVVVCGHYGCGGVAAAMDSRDLGLLNPWLREIRDVYRLYSEELDSIQNKEDRYRRLVELNVQEQCVRVIKTACVQRQYLRRKAPIVHGWVFDMGNGLLKDLDLPFDEILDGIREIYRLDPA